MHRNRRWHAAIATALVLLVACGGKNKQQSDAGASAEPDKVLYERALEDVRKNRHAVARLTLQTLLNTYPDSEYIAKAKLAIADSYFKEGGTSGLTQSVQEYQDFITFFPFLEEAAYARMQTALAHYRRMEKPDRDRSAARLAEEGFQEFLLKHPDHPLAPQAEQRLREVQEVLAEGDFRIGRFYYIKGSLRAAVARLQEVVDRYPLYSQADRALWMVGDAYERAEKGELATQYYSRIVSEYPLSPLLEQAKERLTALGVPVPQANPEALARMQREHDLEKEKPGRLRRSLGMFRTGPDVSSASRTGKPNLTPPGEPASATTTLTPGGVLTVGVGSADTGNTSAAIVNTPPAATAGENPEKPAAPSAQPNPGPENPKTTGKDAKKDEEKEKEKEKKKKEKESSSKKKKGLRKIIPW